jgi:16S rRNA (guanine966-N2)-methyltransferase
MLEHAPWGRRLAGARVIDLFAGSGALGLEALSRGAATCLFVDDNAAARAAIRQNIETLKVSVLSEIQVWDATRLLPAIGPGFDLAFLDPPYGQGLAIPALASLKDGGWLATDALVVVEGGSGEPPARPPGFEILETRTWGAASVTFLRQGTGLR